MTFSIAGFDVSAAVVALGAVTGLVYGVSAVGLVLVYRSNKLVNFAHGQVGTLGAAVLALAVLRWHLPYWVALGLALLVGGTVGSASEALVARRLRGAPVIIGVIATLGLAQLLYLVASIIDGGVAAGSRFPQPPWMPTFRIGALLVTPAYSAMLILTPVIVAALTIFLRRGRLGLAMRAAAANPDAARMAGVVSDRMAGLAWAIAGALAAYTAVLVLPTRGVTGQDFLGPGLLLRALVCVVVARMTSLPVALGAGVALGIVESLLLANYHNGGLVEMVIFGALVVALLIQPTRTGRAEDKGSWAAVTPWAPLPESYQRVFAIRNMGRILGVGALLIALLAPLATTDTTALVLAVIAAFTVVGLSIGVITGLSGQLSLGQFALAGVGATVCVLVTQNGGNFLLGLLAGAGAAAAMSLVLGLPALRIRGLMLAVTSLAFAVAAQDWLFSQPWMLGSGRTPRAPTLGGTKFNTGKGYYYLALGILVAGYWLARNVWRGGLGRRMRAVRDNEDVARAFSIPPTKVKLQAFVIGGCLAGLGGVAYGTALSFLSGTAFPLQSSINTAGATVVGGLGLLLGPLLGTLYIIGIPKFLPLDNAGLAATALGWLSIIVQYPGGLAQALGPIRGQVLDWLAARGGLDPTVERAKIDNAITRIGPPRPGALSRPSADGRASDGPLLEARNVSVRYGGVIAVEDVSVTVHAGETLGLIGPNGAGKTSLFEALGGFIKADRGSVHFDGQDVTRLAAERRAQLGLIRSFQDAALFPTMTVLDVVALSLERVNPTRVGLELIGIAKPDRRKKQHARELVAAMGLYPWRNTQIHALSTGTRRIAELTSLVATNPRLLLLDEPTSGIAQRESEALGELLVDIKEQFDLTLAIIEHDIPLVMALADRVIVMDAGRIIADGSPSIVRTDPLVIEAYLGGDPIAIERSTQDRIVPVDGSPRADALRCSAVTARGARCRRLAGPDALCAQHRNLERVRDASQIDVRQ